MRRINHEGSAILIALVILIILTVTTTVFFDKVWNFNQSTQGIENSNAAYYLAAGQIEETLIGAGVNKYTPWNAASTTIGSTTRTGKIMRALTGATTIPGVGSGNSIYTADGSYNIISLWEPVQIVIPNGIDWNTVQFTFRVPTIGGAATSLDATKDGSGIILWAIGSTGASLFASGETSTISSYTIRNATTFSLAGYSGTTNTGAWVNFWGFYNGYLGVNGAQCSNYRCTLKLSMIRPVYLLGGVGSGRILNFLEYKITGFPSPIPSQFMKLQAEGYSNGFMRSREINLPQITTNTALDFAILQ